MSLPPIPPSCLFLASPCQYGTCQIQVPDLECSLAAIAINGSYYSFFRLVQDSDCVLSMIMRLSSSGDRIAVIQKANGYSLWVFEPEAVIRPTKPKGVKIKNTPIANGASKPYQSDTGQAPAPATILPSPERFQPLQIQVPDLDKPVKAIAHNGHYYSLFRMEPDPERVITILTKTARRGDATIAIKTGQGYAICVIEPEAALW